MKKRVASIVLVSAMGVGAVTSLALTPALAATSAQASHRLTAIANALKGLVSDGTITQAQADKVAATLDKELPRRGPGGGRHQLLEDAAAVLSMTPEQIRTAMGTTRSLADVAAAQGIDRSDLVSKLLAVVEEHLAAGVQSGRLTQQQADQHKADARARIGEAVDRVGAPPRHRGPRGDGPPPQGSDSADGRT